MRSIKSHRPLFPIKTMQNNEKKWLVLFFIMKVANSLLFYWIFASVIDVLYDYGKQRCTSELYSLSVSIFAQFTTVTIWAIKFLTCIWPKQRSKSDFAYRCASLIVDFICGALIFGIPFALSEEIPFCYQKIYISLLPLAGMLTKQ